MNRRVLAAAAVATVMLLSGCGSPVEEPAPEAETPEAVARVVTAEEAAAYRAKLPTATERTIASIILAAPNDELRVEAEKRRDDIFKKP